MLTEVLSAGLKVESCLFSAVYMIGHRSMPGINKTLKTHCTIITKLWVLREELIYLPEVAAVLITRSRIHIEMGSVIEAKADSD